MNKPEQFILWVNETFKPEHSRYPAGIKTKEGCIVSGETAVVYPEYEHEDIKIKIPIVDYYGEYRGGFPWIHPSLEAMAKKMGLVLEWRDPGSVSVRDDK